MSRRGIILVSRNFPPLLGGMERLNQHVLIELDREFDVHLVGPLGAQEYVPDSKRVIACPIRPIHLFLLCAAFAASVLAIKARPALIIAGSGVNALPAWFAAKLTGTPWIVYLHGLDLVVNNYWYQRIFIPVIRKADAWLVNSRATAALAAEAGLDSRRIYIQHPGVYQPDFKYSNNELYAWRQRHKLDDSPIVLSVGRLTQRKGLAEFVLKALPAVLNRFPNAKLVVVGEEPSAALAATQNELAKLLNTAKISGCSEHIHVLGKLDDNELSIAYAASTVLAFPALDIPGDVEGFGMVAVEAAAHGTPTVAFSVGGIPDAVADGISGRLIPSGNYAEFADAIIDYLEKPPDIHGHESCRTFARYFVWPRFGERLRDNLKELIPKLR